MFVSATHQSHSEVWMVTRPTIQCVACLVDALDDVDLSAVQRQVFLSLLNSIVEENSETMELFQRNITTCNHVLELISSCMSFIQTVSTNSLLCLGDHMEKQVCFDLLVLGKLSFTISHLLESSEFWEEETTGCLAYVMLHVADVFIKRNEHTIRLDDCLTQNIIRTVIIWVNTGLAKEFQYNCLALLKKCLQVREMAVELLTADPVVEQNYTLLMGIKRIIATRDETLTIASVQCITILTNSLTEPQLVKQIFDTDLADNESL